MITIVLASVRHRRTAFVAVFLSIFLGAAILMAFSSMLDTAGQLRVGGADKSALTTIASVVGGWGAIIVGSAVVTTLAVAARQRAKEFALLRSVGASPNQVVRLILGEVLLVGVLAGLLAIPVGFGAGYALLHILQRTDQVSAAIDYRFAGAALGVGLGGSLLAALVATWATARRTAGRRVQDALLYASIGGRGISRTRRILGLVLLAGGLSCAVMTATVLDGAKLESQSIAAEGAILSSLGLALLAPVILRAATATLGPILRRVGGAPAQLGLLGIRQRIQSAATPLMPIIVCTAIATGTIYMQSIWNSRDSTGSADDKNVETLNYVVVGMISVFAAVMLVNLLVAEMTNRRREFALLRLIGSMPGQVYRMVGAETALLLAVGLLFGTLAGLLTVVPYSIAVDDKALPDTSGMIYVAVVVAVGLLTVTSSFTAAWRATHPAAVEVIHAAAA